MMVENMRENTRMIGNMVMVSLLGLMEGYFCYFIILLLRHTKVSGRMEGSMEGEFILVLKKLRRKVNGRMVRGSNG